MPLTVPKANNACATGSTGLHMARTLVRSGAADCVLVIGFEQMSPGSIKSVWSDRPSPMGTLLKSENALSWILPNLRLSSGRFVHPDDGGYHGEA